MCPECSSKQASLAAAGKRPAVHVEPQQNTYRRVSGKDKDRTIRKMNGVLKRVTHNLCAARSKTPDAEMEKASMEDWK